MQGIAAVCDRGLKDSSNQDSLESRMLGKLARPVWGWGGGATPPPTPQGASLHRSLRYGAVAP